MDYFICVFDINNSQDHYARCLRIMQEVEKGQINYANPDIKEFNCGLYKVDRRTFNSPKRYALNLENLKPPRQDLKILDGIDQGKYMIRSHFRLTTLDEEDVVNIHYFLLLRKIFSDCTLSLKCFPNNNDELYFKISLFMVFESKNPNDRYIFAIKESANVHSVSNLAGAGTKTKGLGKTMMSKFLPVIEINLENYRMLSSPVEESVNSYWKCKGYMDISPFFPERDYEDYSKKSRLEILLDICTYQFCNNSGKDDVDAAARDMFFSKRFFEAVKNQSLLSFIILCTMEHFHRESVKESRKANKSVQMSSSQQSINEVLVKLSYARDCADSLLQIMENALFHSTGKSGYFTFRVHSYDSGNKYLESRYEKYFNNEGTRTDTHYLEIFVSDYYIGSDDDRKGSIILQTFRKNLEDRISNLRTSIHANQNGGIDADIQERAHTTRRKEILQTYLAELQEFPEKFSDFKLAGFFDKNPIWSDYCSLQANIVNHYGISLYEKITRGSDGCFEVVSSKAINASNDHIYSSIAGLSNDGGDALCFIPGTHYMTLLPLRHVSAVSQYVGIDVDVSSIERLKKLLDENWQIIDLKLPDRVFDYISIKGKMESVEDLAVILSEQICPVIFPEMPAEPVGDCKKVQYIFRIDVNNLEEAHRVELLCKAIFQFLLEFNSEGAAIKILFRNCSSSYILEFARIASIFYDKAGSFKAMDNMEMYFMGSKYEDELVLSGSSLDIAHSVAYRHAVSRGTFPDWLSLLAAIWNKRTELFNTKQVVSLQSRQFQYMPFEMIVDDKNQSRFEETVYWTLNNHIDRSEMGCLIDNTHVRVGSKIHVGRFYEAELLFQNNYFTNRFAYLIARDIREKLLAGYGANAVSMDNIVLVGYENYSEMLLYETCRLLNVTQDNPNEPGGSKDIPPYIIYISGEDQPKFKYIERVKDPVGTTQNDRANDLFYIIIVPINSTFTTHNKIKAALYQELHIDSKISNRIFANYAVILVRHGGQEDELKEIEERFWEDLDYKRKEIETRLISPPIRYFVSVEGQWQDPLQCKKCYPYRAVDEEPLIETNITSVIPSLQQGLLQDVDSKTELIEINKERQRIAQLARYLRYGHSERNGNHFLYYIETDRFFSKYKKKIIEWLKKEVKPGIENEHITYNFIVTPLHTSNAGFVEEVNYHIFDSTAQVLRFEIDREYRDNVKSKYSNLTMLLENIKTAKGILESRVEINFHFVDDTIVSGKTVQRAHSLISSLFSRKELRDDNISINIFKNIILLMNRCSDDSKRDYLDDISRFHSFVDLNIPSIRNHRDFCFMCSLIKAADRLDGLSSTNGMSGHWKGKAHKFQCVDIDDSSPESVQGIGDADRGEGKEDNEGKKSVSSGTTRHMRHQTRMIATHLTGATLNKMGDMRNNTEAVFNSIVNLIYQELWPTVTEEDQNRDQDQDQDRMDVLVSYIKVLSRPFLAYRKSVREAIFKLLILFMEVFLNDNDDTESQSEDQLSGICGYITEIKNRADNDSLNLLMILMKQLVELNSNYIIRKDNVKKIFSISKQIYEVEDEEMLPWEFYKSYAALVKQLTCLNGDETKSTWLEYLLLTGNEYNDRDSSRDKTFRYGIEDQLFGELIYLENTRVLADAIRDIAKNYSNASIDTILEDSEYYLDNFWKILEYNGWLYYYHVPYYWKEFKKVLKGNTGAKLINMRDIFIKLDEEIDETDSSVGLNGVAEDNAKPRIKQELVLFEYYNDLARKISGATGASHVQFLVYVGYRTTEDSLKESIFGDSKASSDYNNFEIHPIFDVRQINSFVLGSYSVVDDDGQFYAIIRFDQSDSPHNPFNEEFDRFDENQIYMILEFKELAPSDTHTRSEIIKNLRNIMIFRSRITSKLRNDFVKNRRSTYESLQESYMKRILLEHTKNARHSDNKTHDDILEIIQDGINIRARDETSQKSINEMLYANKMEFIDSLVKGDGKADSYGLVDIQWQEYIYCLEAACLRLLSDINVSKWYHSFLSDRAADNYKDHEVSDLDLRDSITFQRIDVVSRITTFINNSDAIYISPELNKYSMHYLISEVVSAEVLILPLIQNALEHQKSSEQNGAQTSAHAVKLYPMPARDDLGLDLYYLCVENSYQDAKDADIGDIMNECTIKPIGARNLKKPDNHGISLYATNRYCELIIKKLYPDEEIPKHLLKIDTQSIPNRVIIKLPILTKCEEEN